MAAAVLAAPRTIKVERQALPKLSDDSVMVQLEGCGVCGSNLPIWEGRPWVHYPQPPGAPGHEGWGRVCDLGSKVENLSKGDRVAVLSRHAFAEYDVTPAAQAVPLPAALDGQPFPGAAIGSAMNAFRRSGIEAGQTVTVIGIGFLGAILVNLASRAGARVIAVSRRPFALEMAKVMGAKETIALDHTSRVVSEILSMTDRSGCERVIEATGQQEPLNLAGEIIQERGRMIIVGYHQDGLRQVNMQLWNWRGIDIINAHERSPQAYREGVKAAVNAVANGTLDPTPLYTHFYPLERLSEALDSIQQRPSNFLKTLVTCM